MASRVTYKAIDVHRVARATASDVCNGQVSFSISKASWILGMFSCAVVGGYLTFSWSALALFVFSTVTVLLFGHSLGSHRKMVHNSFQCPLWLEYSLVYLGVLVGLSGPIGLLRQHEIRDYAQRLPDCHDYLKHGSPFWKDGYWQLLCDFSLLSPPNITIESRIRENRFYSFLERTWVWQHLFVATLFYGLGGWGFVFWGVCARVSAGVVGHWLIGYFAHNHGDMNYEVKGAAVQGRNIPFTSLLTMGESWHNNHHAYPGSAKLGLYEDEWDPGWWVLLLLQKIGLVWGIRLPQHLPMRPELFHLKPNHSGVKIDEFEFDPRPAVNLYLTMNNK